MFFDAAVDEHEPLYATQGSSPRLAEGPSQICYSRTHAAEPCLGQAEETAAAMGGGGSRPTLAGGAHAAAPTTYCLPYTTCNLPRTTY
jgi:hypothetical protein